MFWLVLVEFRCLVSESAIYFSIWNLCDCQRLSYGVPRPLTALRDPEIPRGCCRIRALGAVVAVVAGHLNRRRCRGKDFGKPPPFQELSAALLNRC